MMTARAPSALSVTNKRSLVGEAAMTAGSWPTGRRRTSWSASFQTFTALTASPSGSTIQANRSSGERAIGPELGEGLAEATTGPQARWAERGGRRRESCGWRWAAAWTGRDREPIRRVTVPDASSAIKSPPTRRGERGDFPGLSQGERREETAIGLFSFRRAGRAGAQWLPT